MNTDTPAREIRQKDLDKNSAAFAECLQMIPAQRRLKRVLDIRYGLGGWASRMAELRPPELYIGFEADPQTAERAVKPGNIGLVLVRDRFASSSRYLHDPYDLLLADFNNLTSMKAEPLLEALRFAEPRCVIFTDVACSKLHLNFPSYGLKRPDHAGYVRAFAEKCLPDWKHVHTARLHHHAATLVFTR